ncbi:MAG: glycosyltransferase family 4 protein [Candidatus Eisenbacteria bacterium]|uniref:Glycosyltransferase family 4 protein n=1 Tax=Eiseniibacteriota bacterium TaxID=2212470 RepID=A0A7Y2H2N8_UNCEI|nr:glycosyltransferase family 4 protein [Candidatus Eisenbacteria bacterium]
MRIAMIGQKGIPATYGGIERHVEEIGARLVKRGHSVRVYTRKHYAPGSTPHLGMERSERFSLNTKHLDALTHSLSSSLDVLFRPVDLVHFHALGPSSLAWLPRLRGIPTVVTLHGLDWEREKWGRMASYILEKCEYPALHFPKRCIVVSKTLRKYFEEKYLIRPTYIPNGVKDAVHQSASLLERWGVQSGEYFVFVGRLTPEKGTHLLIDAFGQMKTNKKLVIAGGSAATDDYVADLKTRANENVIFTDYVHGEELEALWGHSYAVVLPSTLEGLSIALLEGLSYGKCVLVSDIPENLEVVEDYCPQFESKNVSSLREALEALDRNPHQVQNYERLVNENLKARFQWDTVVDQLDSLYRSVYAGEKAVVGKSLES